MAVAPVVFCRNSGTNTVTAKSAAVPRNSVALATATGRVRSRSNGTIGSAARRSRAGSAAHSAALPAANPRIMADVHA